MTSSGVGVLEYGRPRRGQLATVVRTFIRMLAVLLAAGAVGGALAWLLVPVVYVDDFRIYDRPTVTGPFGNALATRAVQLESPTFIATAVAPLVASGKLAAGDIRTAKVHAGVGRRDDIITVSVRHRDPQIAAAVSNALLTAAVAPPQAPATPTPSTGPTTEAARRLTQAIVGAMIKPTIVLQPPQPASQLRPRFDRLGWTLSALCMCVPAIAAVCFARKWIFSISFAER